MLIERISIFVSQPFHGYSAEEINETLQEAKVWCYRHAKNLFRQYPKALLELDVYNMYSFEDLGPNANILRDFDFIDRSDIILFMPGWENSQGCQMERRYAIASGKARVFDYPQNLQTP